MIRIRITSADISSLLSALLAQSVLLYDIEAVSELTVEASIHRLDYPLLIKTVQKRAEKAEVRKTIGIYWNCKRLLNRPVIVCMLVLFMVAVFYLPGRIFFIRVEGNSSVPERLILARAEECGIGFGALRRDVRSEKMKNALLEAIPELKWAGINTDGCVATISVTERTRPVLPEQPGGVSSIVAVRDGIVTDCTVTKGNALCKIGQAVKEGQVLVSGYTDCGFKIQAAAAEAEVYGITNRNLQVLMPSNYSIKGEISGTKKKYSLQIGKNKINFYQDSGISPTGCDKMYSEYYWTLPGGFRLPVALIVEEYTYYDDPVLGVSFSAGEAALYDYAENYLSQQMLSGTVLDADAVVEQLPDCYLLNAQYTCRELIGRVKSEEIILNHGEND